MTIKSLVLKIFIPIMLTLIMAGYLIWNTVPSKLGSHLSQNLKTTVFIGDATFGLNQISFYKLAINSPRNSKLPQAFACESLHVDAFAGQYLKNDITIDLIELDDVYLGLEFDSPKSTTGNWSRLMDNLQETTQATNASSTKTVLIKRLVIKNINCQVVYANKNDGVINLKPIPEIVFENISSSEGFPIDQLTNSVLGKMLKEVFVRQNLQDMLNKWINPQQQLNKALKPFKMF